jgi:hypothetical protein
MCNDLETLLEKVLVVGLNTMWLVDPVWMCFGLTEDEVPRATLEG